MAVVFKAESLTNSRFCLEVDSKEKPSITLHLEIIDRQENCSNSVDLTKDEVGGLIKHLQKQYSKMED